MTRSQLMKHITYTDLFLILILYHLSPAFAITITGLFSLATILIRVFWEGIDDEDRTD